MSPVELLTERYDLGQHLWARYIMVLDGIVFRQNKDSRHVLVKLVWPDDRCDTLTITGKEVTSSKDGRHIALWLIDRCNQLTGVS